MLSLVFRDAATGTARRFGVPEREVLLGRDVGKDGIEIVFEGVSRRHATVRTIGRAVRLDDLGSKNGILAGRTRLDSVVLQPGDAPVQIGRSFLTVEESDTGDLANAFPVERWHEPAPTTMPLRNKNGLGANVLHGIVYESDVMKRVIDVALKFAPIRDPLLLLGETGTGKDLLARFIHDNGPYAGGPFRAENCAAITEELFASEVFGIEGGVATGVGARPGLFAAAERGTLFLDEIGDVSAKMQAALLLAIERHEIRPSGARQPRPVRVRVILATNRPESLRDDLRFRCKAITIPPLRERPGDIAPLTEHFLRRAAEVYGMTPVTISRRAVALLAAQPWPGNVRELKDVLERAFLLCSNGLHEEDIRHALGAPPEAVACSMRERHAARTRDAVARALRENGGNKSAAARDVGMSRSGLRKAVRRFGLDDPQRP